MLVTFTYSVILVPAWNWVGTITAAVPKTTSGSVAAKPMSNSPVKNQSSGSMRNAAPFVAVQEKTPKPANCDRIIKQINAGKYVELPEECRSAYEISRQRMQESERAQQEAERQKAAEQQREYESRRAEQEYRRQIETAQQRDAERQREQERRQQEADQTRAANYERQRQRQESDDLRRREQTEEADRRQAQREANQREQQRQREVQKRNDALIRLGNDIRNKIFKKNR